MKKNIMLFAIVILGMSIAQGDLLAWGRSQSQKAQGYASAKGQQIHGDWNIIKGKLQQKWGNLTDDDLRYTNGKRDELVGRIQKRTGESREAVEKAIDDASM